MAQASTRKKANGNGQSSTQADFASMFAENGKTFEAMAEANKAMMQGWSDMNQELMRFFGERFKQDMDCTQSLMGCSRPEEFMDVQRGFMEQAMRDYWAEAEKLMIIANGMARNGWAPVEERAAHLAESGQSGAPAAK